MFTAVIERLYIETVSSLCGTASYYLYTTVRSVGMSRSPKTAVRLATEQADRATEEHGRRLDQTTTINGRTIFETSYERTERLAAYG